MLELHCQNGSSPKVGDGVHQSVDGNQLPQTVFAARSDKDSGVLQPKDLSGRSEGSHVLRSDTFSAEQINEISAGDSDAYGACHGMERLARAFQCLP